MFKKTVFLSVSNPLIVRNFFLIPGGVVSLLKEQGIRLIVLVPLPAEEQMKKDFGSTEVIIEPISVNWKRTFLQRIHTFFSTYLIFTETQQLLAKYGTRADIEAAGGKSFLYPFKFAISRTLGRWGWFKNVLMSKVSLMVYPERPYKELYDKYKPDLVFLPDFHSMQDTALLREAKRHGIKTTGLSGSWDHFVKKFEPLKLDSLMVWNEPVKKEAISLQGYQKSNVIVTGPPYYDIFAQKNLLLSREEFCKKINFDPKRKIIFFGSRGRYTPNDGDIVAILLDAIKGKALTKEAQILVRPYPGARKEESEKFAQFEEDLLVHNDWIEPKKIFGHSGFTWYPSLGDLIHFMNCLYHADVIINTYSSITVEGSFFLKPIININFDGNQKLPFKRSIKRFERMSNFVHVNEVNGVVIVNNKEELVNAVNRSFNDPQATIANVTALRDKMCYKADGGAAERIATHILNILSVAR